MTLIKIFLLSFSVSCETGVLTSQQKWYPPVFCDGAVLPTQPLKGRGARHSAGVLPTQSQLGIIHVTSAESLFTLYVSTLGYRGDGV
jgi:hypothetical protein